MRAWPCSTSPGASQAKEILPIQPATLSPSRRHRALVRASTRPAAILALVRSARRGCSLPRAVVCRAFEDPFRGRNRPSCGGLRCLTQRRRPGPYGRCCRNPVAGKLADHQLRGGSLASAAPRPTPCPRSGRPPKRPKRMRRRCRRARESGRRLLLRASPRDPPDRVHHGAARLPTPQFRSCSREPPLAHVVA
jgi:hypothetical protein